MDDENVISANNSTNFTKIITKQGESSSRPTEGCTCTIICKVLSSHPKLTNSHVGILLDKNVQIKLGYFNTEISRYLQVAIETMKINEVAEISFEMNEKLIFPDQNNVKAFIFLDLKFQVELIHVDYTNSDKAHLMNIDQLYDLALMHKNDANQIFKSNLYLTAFYRYQTAIRYLIIAQQLDKSEHDHEKTKVNEEVCSDHKKKILELKSVLYLNISACQLKYPDNSQNVIKNCSKCLEIDAHNVKALFRRALGYIEISEFDKAIEDLKLALSYESNNKVVEEKLRQIESIKKKNDEKMSSNLRKMFE